MPWHWRENPPIAYPLESEIVPRSPKSQTTTAARISNDPALSLSPVASNLESGGRQLRLTWDFQLLDLHGMECSKLSRGPHVPETFTGLPSTPVLLVPLTCGYIEDVSTLLLIPQFDPPLIP